MAKDRAADGAGKKANRKGRERGKRSDPGVEFGKELAIEDERRGGSVDQKIVPFDDGADGASTGDCPDARGLGFADLATPVVVVMVRSLSDKSTSIRRR